MVVPNEILQAVKDLQPLSKSAVRLIELTNDPGHNLREVVQVVQWDSVLTAHVLRVANSAAFARRAEIVSIDRALTVLGERTIAGIALGLCTAQLYRSPLMGYGGGEGELWRHCLRAAIAARELAKLSRVPVNPDTAFTAGIVHDIGKAVISRYLEGCTGKMVEGYDSGVFSDYLEAERDALGTDHAEVGAALALHWTLPAVLGQVLLCHHNPQSAPEEHRPLVYIVHTADLVAMMFGNGTGVDTMGYKLDEHYRDYLDISRRVLEQVMMRTEDEFLRTAEVMSMKAEDE